eukprot:Lithocolla_globosa_v1_NODE_1865_length_2286_cov_42.933214.p1 type:complete len:650 gc:universal NODE_1865_length_2286_cov_42.933214:1976-27(-)
MAEVFEEDVMGLISVSLVDKSIFKFAFKSTTTTEVLLAIACEKIGVKQANFFGLQRVRDLRSDLTEDTSPKVWLSEKQTIFSQGCDSSTTLFLRHKYWFHDVDELIDDTTIQLTFEEVDRKLMTDKFTNSEDVNIQLAACRMQIANGDYQEGGTVMGEDSVKYLLPRYIQDNHNLDEWHALIGLFHQKLRGKSKKDTQKEYLQLAKDNTKNLQAAFFPAQYTTREMKRKVEILVGVTPEGVGFYAKKGTQKTLQVFHRFRDLKSWLVNPLWNGQEAPDHPELEPAQQLEDYVIGPYRSALFIKPKSKRTKDLEFEVSSFLTDDDNLITFMNYYSERFEQFVSLMVLEDSVQRYVTVSSMDGIKKKLRVTNETTGQELVHLFADKIGLEDTSFFQLANTTDGADRWIALKEPVLLQGLSPTSQIMLKLRFFSKDPTQMTDQNSTAKNLYFLQLRELVVNGDIPVAENDAIEMAALFLQYTVGDFDSKKEKAGYIGKPILKEYIPFYLVGFHSRSHWEKKILASHERITGMDRQTVVNKYLKMCTSLPNYGLTYFDGIIPKTDDECVIGVARQGLAMFRVENLELLASYRFGYELRSWSNDGEAIEITTKASRNSEEKIVTIVSLQFAEVIDLLVISMASPSFDRQLSTNT